MSVRYDEKRATVTTSGRTALKLQKELRVSGIVATEVKLRGRFHCQCYHDDMKHLIRFCESQPDFQFPNDSLVLPTRFHSKRHLTTQGKLHEAALQSILLDQCTWYQTFVGLHSTRLNDKQSTVAFFGPERCVPPSMMRKLGPRVVYFADLNEASAQWTAGEITPETPLSSQQGRLDNDIAVVGMSCKVAGADDVEEFWQLLCEGRSQHKEVPSERFTFKTVWRDIDPKRKWYGNFINDHDTFDHKFFKKTPREIGSTDPQQRLMLEIAYQAVEQSGYFRSPDVDSKIGCYIGVCAADYEHNVACYAPNAFSAIGNLKSFIAGKISHYFGWTGPGLTIDTACSSSAVAVHQACRAILSGECTAALAGGTNVMTSPLWFQNLAGASFLSPTGQCKPFEASADGYCRGEGIAAVFLKNMSRAISDGDQILGTISGTAVYQNQNCTSIFVPNAPSLCDLFHDVSEQAGLDPQKITVVEAHGTGTPVGDPAEYESIRRVFGGPLRSKPLPFGSVKGLIGHTECTSGVVSLIKILLMIHEGLIPPQASFSKLNPSIETSPSDNMEILTTLKPWNEDFRAALINNYGASGSNASMVVTQAPVIDSSNARKHFDIQSSESEKQPFWFCGIDDRSLQAYAARFRQFLKSKTYCLKKPTLANIAFNVSRQSNRGLARALVFSCRSVKELDQSLADFENGSKAIGSVARPPPRPVVLCFGGQVSRFVGLDRGVYENVKVLRTYLDECDTLCRSMHIDSIYPRIFERNPVHDPVQLQTMLFAMQYSCAKSWLACGVKPAAVVGHSFGELTALCISGVLTVEDTLKVIAGRARIIRDSWGAEKGSMMALEGDLDVVEKLLAEASEACPQERAATVACYNGPKSFTLAGSSKAIDAVQETLLKAPVFASMRTKRLDVTNAFHSTLVEPIMAELEKTARDVTFREPSIHLARSTEIKSVEKLTARFMADHMRYPVYFYHSVQRLAQEYPSCIWLEAGSESTVTSMACKALGGSSTKSHFQALNITSDNASSFLTTTTATLWKEGLEVTFWRHHALETYGYSPLLLPLYQFEKARHWVELKEPPKTVAVEAVAQAQVQEEVPKGLFTFVGYQDDKQRSARFRINTMIQKFEDYVSGHTIAYTAPICPGTLQIDIAMEAIMSLRTDFLPSDVYPQLQGLENQSPICIDPFRLVWLDVEARDADCHTWVWKMVSHTAQAPSATTLHVSGTILFRSVQDKQFHLDFAKFERFVGHQRCLALLNNDSGAEVIQGRNIYRIFAEIVDYGERFRGVQKLVGRGNESAGRVVKPYTAETWLGTLVSDCFCQVAGIFVNCMTDRADTDMFIATGAEQWVRSPKLRTGDSRPEVWDVYATHQQRDKAWVSDIFIFDPRDGTLLEVILGINYQRVSKQSMSRLLSRLTHQVANGPQAAAPSAPMDMVAPAAVTHPPPSQAADIMKPKKPKVKKVKKTSSTSPDILGMVKGVLAMLTGLEPHEIRDDVDLIDIGLDSLMGMEMAREIETAFKCSLDMEKLADVTTLPGLMDCIYSALGPIENSGAVEEEEQEEEGKGGEDELEEQTKTRQPEQNGAGIVLSDENAGLPTGLSETHKVNGYAPHTYDVLPDGVAPSIPEKDLALPRELILKAFGSRSYSRTNLLQTFGAPTTWT